MRSSAKSEVRDGLWPCDALVAWDGGWMGTELDAKEMAAACAESVWRLVKGGDVCGEVDPPDS